MLKSHIITLIALLSGVSVLQNANMAQAIGLTLDSFDTPNAANIFTSTGSDRSTNDTGSGFLGSSDRRVISNSGFAASNQSALPGYDIISGAAGGSGQRYLLTYDGSSDSTSQTDISGQFGSLGGVDITGGNAFVDTLRFNFSTDFPITVADAQIDIRAISSVGDVTVSSAFVPEAGTSTYDVGFSAFSGINFNELNALVVQFDNLGGSVFVLDSIETVGSGPFPGPATGPAPGPAPGPASVPEPATVLGSLFVLGFGSTLRSHYKKKATKI